MRNIMPHEIIFHADLIAFAHTQSHLGWKVKLSCWMNQPHCGTHNGRFWATSKCQINPQSILDSLSWITVTATENTKQADTWKTSTRQYRFILIATILNDFNKLLIAGWEYCFWHIEFYVFSLQVKSEVMVRGQSVDLTSLSKCGLM